jgi:hypothetical protein
MLFYAHRHFLAMLWIKNGECTKYGAVADFAEIAARSRAKNRTVDPKLRTNRRQFSGLKLRRKRGCDCQAIAVSDELV